MAYPQARCGLGRIENAVTHTEREELLPRAYDLSDHCAGGTGAGVLRRKLFGECEHARSGAASGLARECLWGSCCRDHDRSPG